MSSVCKDLKVVVVGDGLTGKSHLVLTFVKNDFIDETSIPIKPVLTEEHISLTHTVVDGQLVQLHLWHPPGQEDYDRVRPSLTYQDADVFLILFGCEDLNSYSNVSYRWIPEIRHVCPKVPILLVCNKVDLRDRAGVKTKPLVTREQGYFMAHKIGAYAYLECSAKTRKGVRQVFKIAARAALLPEKTRSKLEQKSIEEKLKVLNIESLGPPRLESIDTETLLTEAMQGGYVECHVAVILMIGVAGAGKTSFLQLVLNRPPLKIRKSTPLAKCAIRAVSISRAAVSEEGTVWNEVTPDDLLEMVGDSITDDSLPTDLPTESSLKSVPTCQTTEHPHPHLVQSEDTSSYDSAQEVTVQSSQDIVSPDFEPLTTVSELSYEKLIVEMKPVRQLITYLQTSNRSGKIFERQWVYIADCGGQPQFIDLIPSYIRNVSGAAIFVKLNEELGSQPQIAYYSQEGKLCGQPYISSLTHMQTIQNCLQVMQSRRAVSGEVECPELFFIGTHRDHEKSCKESMESKNTQLLEMLRSHETVNKHLSYYRLSKPEQLLYPVNAKKPKANDREVAREFREDVMKKCKKVKIKIPLRWFILEQQLQQVAQEHNSAVLSLEDCQKVASVLEMDRPRLLAAIDYLDRLNLFKYLPDVLPDVVFTTSQVLLDKVSDLVELSHGLRGKSGKSAHHGLRGKLGKLTKSVRDVSDEDLVRFRDFGIVNVKLLNQFPKHYVKGLFTSDELILVLTNQLVFAQNGEDVFFMPCVLLDLLLQKLSEYQLDQSSALVSPLLVYYLGGLFPASIFNSLVAFLQNRSSWKVAMRQGLPACLYKNCVKFTHLKHPVMLTLIYSFDYMEVHAQFTVSDGQLPKELISELLDVLFKGLMEAAAVQNYTDLQPKFGFFCSYDHEDSNQSLHLASFNPNNPNCLRCSKDDSCFINVSKSQQIWLDQLAFTVKGNTQEEAQTDCISSTTASPQTANLSSTITSDVADAAADISATTTQRTHEMPPLPVDIPTTTASVSPQDTSVTVCDASPLQPADDASPSQIQAPSLVTTTVPDIATVTLQEIGHKTQLTTEEHYGFLCKALEIHAAKWKDIGRNLQFLPGELTNIEARPMLLLTAPKSFLHAMLEEWLQWAPGDHRGSKDFATLEALQLALSESGLGAAAARLRIPATAVE